MPQLDRIDLRLLDLLQDNARTSQHDLAVAVGLSSPAVAERIRKLEDRGALRGYTAVLDARTLGRDVTAFIAVGISGSQHYPGFLERVTAHSEILECHSVTGQGSHLLKIRTQSTSTLESLLAAIQAWPGVQFTTTSIVLSTLKETARLPLWEPSPEEKASRG
jgi:Lrp/AsnC family transcriptional regulator, leucine-responsive regulatory protein